MTVNSLAAFFSWYVIITFLGLLTFPLVYFLFPALTDRGYSLARCAGLLTWGYVFWLLTSLGLTQNNVGGILFGLLILVGLSATIFINRKTEIANWLRQNLRLIFTVEGLFLLAFAFLAVIRAGNPELDNAEKPMELMFINAILHSTTFPPHDSWLSGYAVSYYYFGYVMAAMLATLTGLTGSVAHNLMTALIFALAAIGAYGILYNLLAAWNRDSTVGNRKPSLIPPMLAPFFLLLVSNLEGFLEVLHQRGLFWGGTQNFWTWLGIKELSDAPAQVPGWIPERFWWWWRASRVISDYDLKGNFLEVIDEFPFFSFLHADLHPHVLAIPFNLLALAISLNIFLGGWRGETQLFGFRLKISKTGFFAAAFTLGGLAFLNTWDILVGATLIVGAYILFCVREEGWSWSRLQDILVLGLPMGLVAILLYLPFYIGFSSQAGGILPNLINPTRGAQLWVMFGPLFVPILAYLIYVSLSRTRRANWGLAILLAVGFTILLWVFSWTLGWVAFDRDPAFAPQYLASQGITNTATFFNAALSRRFSYIGGLLSLLLILIPTIAFLTGEQRSIPLDESQTSSGAGAPSPSNNPASTFIFLLIGLAGVLVLVPDFIYLHDQFGTRLNTIFKFYYQAWLLWSLAAAFGTAILLQKLRGVWDWGFRIGLVVLLGMSLTYPVLSLANKTNNFNPPYGWTLDDFTRIQRATPDEAAAIEWLRSAPFGVLVEAVGGSYTGYARISTYTGLPTVLGWPGHESQWRGDSAPQGMRQDDVILLYNTSNWQTALDILNKYNIRYVYIGGLERSTYLVQEDKFRRNLIQVFQQGDVTVYQLP
jgi:YYY domain-containing protein